MKTDPKPALPSPGPDPHRDHAAPSGSPLAGSREEPPEPELDSEEPETEEPDWEPVHEEDA